MTLLSLSPWRRVAGPACLLLVGLGVMSPASAAWVDPVGGWDVNYQASSGYLPDSGNTTPKWTRVNYVSTNIFNDAVTNEPALFMDRGTANNPRFESTAAFAQGDGDDQMTVDLRFRLIGDAEVNSGDTAFNDGDYQFQLLIVRPANTTQAGDGNNRQLAVIRLAQDKILAGGVEHSVALGTSWHKGRIHLDWASGEIAMYLDDSADAVLTVDAQADTNAATQIIQFGHGTGTAHGSMNLSYLRFTNSELAAVPEPGSLGLLAAGMGAFVIRGSRRAR